MNAEPANPIPHRRLHRAVFIAAGLYNIAWGIFAVLDPQWLFRFAGMPPLNHPQIFACLGMVVGLYGVVYIEVARRPERGWVFAAVGLAGKIFGPIGLLQLIVTGALAARHHRDVRDQRLHLVDSFCHLPPRRIPAFRRG